VKSGQGHLGLRRDQRFIGIDRAENAYKSANYVQSKCHSIVPTIRPYESLIPHRRHKKIRLSNDKRRAAWIKTKPSRLHIISPNHERGHMEREITLEELRIMAQRAGLKLADDELQSLLPGINRLKKQAVELRPLIALETEPAGIFRAVSVSPK
jgi:hypothetical protein